MGDEIKTTKFLFDQELCRNKSTGLEITSKEVSEEDIFLEFKPCGKMVNYEALDTVTLPSDILGKGAISPGRVFREELEKDGSSIEINSSILSEYVLDNDNNAESSDVTERISAVKNLLPTEKSGNKNFQEHCVQGNIEKMQFQGDYHNNIFAKESENHENDHAFIEESLRDIQDNLKCVGQDNVEKMPGGDDFMNFEEDSSEKDSEPVMHCECFSKSRSGKNFKQSECKCHTQENDYIMSPENLNGDSNCFYEETIDKNKRYGDVEYFNEETSETYEGDMGYLTDETVDGDCDGDTEFSDDRYLGDMDYIYEVDLHNKSEEEYVSGEGYDEEIDDLAVLCSERVTQMTRTYNDIEAVNRLLEEKERDLELAAKIGQTLLSKNQELSDKNEGLEEQLAHATEKVKQLKHEVLMKDGLLQAFTHYEGTDTESSDSPGDIEATGVSVLHKKVKLLEDENLQLKLETAQLSAETSDYEEKEAKLVTDCLEQLGDVKQQLEFYRDELMKKTEENSGQKEEITGLLAQIVDLQKKTKVLTLENLDLQKHLEASQDSQRSLTKEISELKDKYDELCELLEESQEEIRRLRSKQRPQAVKHNYLSSSLISIPSDSLASELESSLRSEIEYPMGYSPGERKVHNWKIFETVKAAKKAGSRPSSRRSFGSTASLSSSLHIPGQSPSSINRSHNHSGESTTNASNRSSVYLSDGESVASEGYNADLDSLYGSTTNLGRPGIPGSNDLETALRRLSLRRANELNEQDYFSEEEERRRNRTETESSATPGACRTPDSTLSTGSGLSGLSQLTGNNPYYRLPEKLKIVKPIEGSLTLRHWQQLATPHIGGIFEARPGVQIKGERKFDLEEEVYNISDIEEDDELQEHFAAKRFQDSSTINTYTNSMVKHPSQTSDDEMFDSCADDEMSDASTPQSSAPRLSTAMNSSNQGTSTYSMSLGLAAILQERDLMSPVQEKSTKTSAASNPARFPSIVSDSHFDLGKSKSSAIHTTASNSVTMATTQSKSQDSGMNNNSESNNNLFEKLKNTGFSLYGYLGNWGQRSQTSTTQSNNNNVNMASACSSTAVPTSALNGPNVSDLVTIGTVPASSSSSTKPTGFGSFLGSRSKSGVLGALTSMKESGIL